MVKYSSGWWFGTFFFHLLGRIIQLTNIFQGVETTNQIYCLVAMERNFEWNVIWGMFCGMSYGMLWNGIWNEMECYGMFCNVMQCDGLLWIFMVIWGLVYSSGWWFGT